MLLLDPRRCSWVGLLALTREDTATLLLELLLPFFHLTREVNIFGLVYDMDVPLAKPSMS